MSINMIINYNYKFGYPSKHQRIFIKYSPSNLSLLMLNTKELYFKTPDDSKFAELSIRKICL